MAERIARAGVPVALYTSGATLRPDMVGDIARVFSRIAVSVDGATAAVHDRVRVGPAPSTGPWRHGGCSPQAAHRSRSASTSWPCGATTTSWNRCAPTSRPGSPDSGSSGWARRFRTAGAAGLPRAGRSRRRHLGQPGPADASEPGRERRVHRGADAGQRRRSSGDARRAGRDAGSGPPPGVVRPARMGPARPVRPHRTARGAGGFGQTGSARRPLRGAGGDPARLRWRRGPGHRPGQRRDRDHQTGPAAHRVQPDRWGHPRSAPARGGDAGALRRQRLDRATARPVRAAGRTVSGAGGDLRRDVARLGDPQPRVRRAPPGVRRRRPSRRSPSHWSISSRSCTPKDWCCGTSAPTT